MKQYLKRLGNYLLHGIPQNNVCVNVSHIENGSILSGKRVLVTGGGSGIGFAIAKRCAKEGATVLIVGRDENKLKIAMEQIENCKYISYDLADVLNISSMLEDAEKIVGGQFDSIVLNAGVSFHEENIKKVTIDGFEKQFQINLESTYFLAQAFIERRKKEKPATMLLVSSERGFQCDDVPYGLTKAAVNSLTRGLSRRFYRLGLRVNAIAPGITTSNMTGIGNEDNLALDRVASGRVFLADEVAEVALFLLSDASKCISGEVVACDAGEYISSYF